MKIACLAFTHSGEGLAEIINNNLNDVNIICRKDYSDLKEKVKEIFETYEGIIFISSTGIATRLIASYIKNKKSDPAIIVVDDLGRYSISLLSGHLGGANELALKVSKILKAEAIITTASDGRNIEAVDMFAKRNNLQVENMEAVKKITAMMIDKRRIALNSEIKINKINYENISDIDDSEGIIFVTSKENINFSKPFCILRPKNINLGIGCRKGKAASEIISFIKAILKDNNISTKCIKTIATFELKKDEEGIIKAAEFFNCEMKIFSKEEIEKVQDRFKVNEFVKKSVGVTSVAEPCAYLAGGRLIVNRIASSGMTLAISKEE